MATRTPAKGVDHRALLRRLRRVQGQVGGVCRMIEERRYCIDILQQLTATRKALDQVAVGIMSNHINGCVSDAIKRQEGPAKVDELVAAITRFVR